MPEIFRTALGMGHDVHRDTQFIAHCPQMLHAFLVVAGLGEYVTELGAAGQTVFGTKPPCQPVDALFQLVHFPLVFAPDGQPHNALAGRGAKGRLADLHMDDGAQHQPLMIFGAVQGRQCLDQTCNGHGRVASHTRIGGVGRCTLKKDAHALGGALHGVLPDGHLSQREVTLVVPAVDGLDAFLFQQRNTLDGTCTDLFGVLEDQIEGVVTAQSINFQCKSRQCGTMSVVTAFVGNTGDGGAIGQINGFVDGQGIHIGPEGQLFALGSAPVNGVKPRTPVDDFQLGVCLQKGHQPSLGALFFAGKFGMLVQFMAQCQCQFIGCLMHSLVPQFRRSSAPQYFSRHSSKCFR